ncbi:MAG: SDR family oxidoreductase [Myxococcales bacterium]|nr:SDR family oxidoreductase [Myxococcales bacterium]
MRYVVTGANRGIGLELVRQLASRGDEVEAVVRDPAGAGELERLAARTPAQVRVHACDVASDSSVNALARSIGPVPVDVLINNAGVMGRMLSLEELDLEDAMHTFDVNALGPVRVVRAMLPSLLKSEVRRVVHITSGMGSIADNTSGGAYGYRMSKAALNMANKSMSVDLASRRFTCVVINPGWVQTDMGGAGAPTPVAESVSKMLAIVDGLSPSQTGTFFDYKGGTFPY